MIKETINKLLLRVGMDYADLQNIIFKQYKETGTSFKGIYSYECTDNGDTEVLVTYKDRMVNGVVIIDEVNIVGIGA